MAGALTANAVNGRVLTRTVGTDVAAISDVSTLSPVDGANNALLTAVIIVGETDATDTATFQWFRGGIGGDIGDDSIGATVGDPFVIDIGDSELDSGPVVVQAIDRGAGLTSAYVLMCVCDDGANPDVAVVSVDAVLYD